MTKLREILSKCHDFAFGVEDCSVDGESACKSRMSHLRVEAKLAVDRLVKAFIASWLPV